MRERTTDGGIVVYDKFVDLSGNEVQVEDHGDNDRPTVWIFSFGGDGDDWPMHLDVDQARRVRDALDAFVKENGSND